MNIIEVQRIINEKLEILRPGSTYSVKKDKNKIPDLNPIYAKTVELRNRMLVHAELDKKPYDMMKKRGPYEDVLQFEYREKNWQSITMPYFMGALSELNRIMNPSNYAIQWDKSMDKAREYFYDEVPLFGSITAFFEQIVLVQKIIDPNALLVVKPYYLPTKEYEGENGPELIFDDQQEIPVFPCVVECTKVIDYMQGRFAMIQLDEKSPVMHGNKKVMQGLVFEFYDTENIYRIVQVGVKNEWTFETSVYYPHNLGYLPCEKLKGIPFQQDLHVYFQSYFINAIPHLDTALYENSNLDMAVVTQVYPQRSEYVDKCDEPECEGGWIKSYVQEKEHRTPCSKCKGTGTISNVGPMMVKQVSVGNSFVGEDKDASKYFPGVAYTAPPAEPLEFLWKKINRGVEQAFSFLGVNISISDVKGSETALGKQIDREKLFAFLMGISPEFFDLIEFTIKAMGEMRYSDFIVPKVVAPTSFAIRSEEDLTMELIEGKKANLPDIALREIVKEFMGKRFSNLKDVEPVINLAFSVDRFITCNKIDMATTQAQGNCMLWEVVLHDSIYTFIDNILQTDDSFFDKPIEEQKKALIDQAKALAAEIEKSKPGGVKDIAIEEEDEEDEEE